MEYYKIIQDNHIIDVNNVFFCCASNNVDLLLECSSSTANFIATTDGTLYITDWTRPVTNGAIVAPYIKAVFIDKAEYDELKSLLHNQQTVEIPIIDNNNEQINRNEPQQEVVDIVALKQKILYLENVINQLLNK